MDEWFAQRSRAAATGFRDLVHRSLTKSGRVIWQSVNGVPVFDAAGKLTGYRGTGADITARKQAEERIQYLATRDALTGLPNRVLLADRANQAILAAARARGSLALLLPRPGPLQAGQRFARPRRRRRAAARGRRAPRRARCGATTRWRAWAATNSCCCGTG